MRGHLSTNFGDWWHICVWLWYDGD